MLKSAYAYVRWVFYGIMPSRAPSRVLTYTESSFLFDLMFFIPRFHLFIEIKMTLFIELPVHCRDTCELNSNDCVAKPRCLEEEDNELSVGDSSKSKVSAEDSVVERDRDDSFLSDPNLISVRFPPSPSCSQFSVLISSRHVRSVASRYMRVEPFSSRLH